MLRIAFVDYVPRPASAAYRNYPICLLAAPPLTLAIHG
jgi:hypothetical protein